MERCCGFTCNGGSAGSTGKFLWAFSSGLNDQTNFKSTAIVRCDSSKQGTGTVYLYGYTATSVNNRIYFQSLNFTECYVDAYGVLGFFEKWDKTYISNCRYYKCYQNGNGDAAFHFAEGMYALFDLSSCDFIYCETSNSDFFCIKNYDTTTVMNNVLLAYCKWGGVLFWGERA
jgi:hypothetical protein